MRSPLLKAARSIKRSVEYRIHWPRQTKTLAKIATKLAKEATEGVYDIAARKDPDSVLAGIDVEDV